MSVPHPHPNAMSVPPGPLATGPAQATPTTPPAPLPPPSTPADAPASRDDLPGWLPPMLAKELRQGLRQRGFVFGLLVMQITLLGAFVTAFATDVGDGSAATLINSLFWSITSIVLLLGSPLRALGSLHPEMDSRTIDLLLLTRLDAWRIVWGKWVSLMAQTLLLLVTLLPFAVVRYFFGEVDLLSDFQAITIMFLGGAVFTALGLWASGLPKALRVLIIFGYFAAAFSLYTNVLRYAFSRGFSSGLSGSGAPPLWTLWVIGTWTGALLLVYALVQAVRCFAPPAENHAILPRLLPLALALPAAALAAWNTDAAEAQLVFALCGLVVIGASELSSPREVMAIHLRGWLARGRGWSGFTPLFLPGWPSAATWLALMTVLSVVGWGVADAADVRDLHFGKVAWLALLGWTGMVFPCLLVALLPTAGRGSGFLFFLLHGLLGCVALLAGSTALASRTQSNAMRVLDWISHAVPTSSFWHAVAEFERPSDLLVVEFGQTLGVAVTLGLMLVTARPYWMQVRIHRHAARKAGPAS